MQDLRLNSFALRYLEAKARCISCKDGVISWLARPQRESEHGLSLGLASVHDLSLGSTPASAREFTAQRQEREISTQAMALTQVWRPWLEDHPSAVRPGPPCDARCNRR